MVLFWESHRLVRRSSSFRSPHESCSRSSPSVNLSSFSPASPDPLAIIEVIAKDGHTGDDVKISYSDVKLVGAGSFGVVSSARLISGLEGLEGDLTSFLPSSPFSTSLF